MHANGLANQPTSRSRDDGLTLIDAWIAAAVRCAPPDNKPTPAEITACHPHLRAELAALPNVRVFVALGRIAYDAVWRLIAESHEARLRDAGRWPRKRPAFEHAGVYRLPGAPTIVAAYHPSRQNTNTGRLTSTMLRRAFSLAAREARRETAG
jgi:uracil-DNA glycosylase family 4